MKSKILILVSLSETFPNGYIPPKEYKRIILIAKSNVYKSYLEKATKGEVFISYVPFNIDFTQILADIYAKIGKADENPFFEIVYFNDSFEENHLVSFLENEIESAPIHSIDVDE